MCKRNSSGKNKASTGCVRETPQIKIIIRFSCRIGFSEHFSKEVVSKRLKPIISYINDWREGGSERERERERD